MTHKFTTKLCTESDFLENEKSTRTYKKLKTIKIFMFWKKRERERANNYIMFHCFSHPRAWFKSVKINLWIHFTPLFLINISLEFSLEMSDNLVLFCFPSGSSKQKTKQNKQNQNKTHNYLLSLLFVLFICIEVMFYRGRFTWFSVDWHSWICLDMVH